MLWDESNWTNVCLTTHRHQSVGLHIIEFASTFHTERHDYWLHFKHFLFLLAGIHTGIENVINSLLCTILTEDKWHWFHNSALPFHDTKSFCTALCVQHEFWMKLSVSKTLFRPFIHGLTDITHGCPIETPELTSSNQSAASGMHRQENSRRAMFVHYILFACISPSVCRIRG